MPYPTDQFESHRDAAFHSLKRGELENAKRQFTDLVTAGSKDPQDQFGLAMVYYNQREWEACADHLGSACQLQPGFVHAWLYLGVVEEQRGKIRAASSAYLRADRLMSGSDPSTIPAEVRALLGRGSRLLGDELFAVISSDLAEVIRDYSPQAIQRIIHAAEMFCGKRQIRYAHPRLRPGLFYVPDLQPRPFFSRDDFDWVNDVEASTGVIREELMVGLQTMQGFEPYVQYAADSREAQVWSSLNNSMSWSTLHIARHGKLLEDSCARFPKTFGLINAIPDLHDVPGYGPEIMFSILHPKTKIPAHRGSVNGRLVAHLPLIVPSNCGYLRVEEQKHEWEEGKLLIFDDTFDHEAINESENLRVVLIFDLWNPQLTIPERLAFQKVLNAAARFEADLNKESSTT